MTLTISEAVYLISGISIVGAVVMILIACKIDDYSWQKIRRKR